MVTRNERNTGFTLVEILIVVVILGILAAVVIPQFADASTSAKVGSLVTQLQTVRSQLELYQIEHNGDYPTIAMLGVGDWGVMTGTTDVDGLVAGSDYGPYLQKSPVNPFTTESLVVAGTALADGATATDGWIYDDTTGAILAVGFDETTGAYTAD